MVSENAPAPPRRRPLDCLRLTPASRSALVDVERRFPGWRVHAMNEEFPGREGDNLLIAVPPPDEPTLRPTSREEFGRCIVLFVEWWGEMTLEYGGWITHEDLCRDRAELLDLAQRLAEGRMHVLSLWDQRNWEGALVVDQADPESVARCVISVGPHLERQITRVKVTSWGGRLDAEWEGPALAALLQEVDAATGGGEKKTPDSSLPRIQDGQFFLVRSIHESGPETRQE